jgi:hypothetical protein
MRQFLWGLLTTETAVAALFFLRFWWVSRDPLFMYFALAFASMAVNWLGLSLIDPAYELQHYVYLFRLLAFILIVTGIVEKNRKTRRRC